MTQDMDKKTILAVVLSIAIIFLWQVLFPASEAKKAEQTVQENPQSTLEKVEKVESQEGKEGKEEKLEQKNSDPIIVNKSNILEKMIRIEDERLIRVLSNKNGLHFKEYLLKEYHADNDFAKNDENHVNLINDSFNHNGFTVDLKLLNGKTLRLESTNFILIDSNISSFHLTESMPELNLRYQANLDGKTVYQSVRFYHDRFDYDMSFDFSAFASDLADAGVQFRWKNGMPYTESNSFEDENMSLVFLDGETDYYRFDTADEESETFKDAKFKHLTIRSKFFMTSIIPQNLDLSRVEVSQKARILGDKKQRRYQLSFSSNQKNPKFKFYTGPYKESELDKYEEFGLDNVFLNASGYEHLFSIFSKPLHSFLLIMYDLIGNFGLAIILFTILVKLALFPLTKKSYQGMKSMSTLQPRIQKLKEKHGNNTMEMQHAMRNLYQEEGVNPLSGCLPMLLQMPLLFALFQVFRGAIELRGASFLWIENFAAPDAFPIGLDALGFATINLLPVLLAVSQILTSKQTMTDPNQKAMVYVMPIVMLFMFYNWNAALNFYYLLFNAFTSIQQKFIKKPEDEKKELLDKTPDGFIANKKTEAIRVEKKKKQMYKKKK